jgi:hypothetical protein
MRFDKELIIGLSFLALSLGSASYISISTLDYLRLYPALTQVQAKVETVSFPSGAGSTPFNITVTATSTNPTDYYGFRLADVMATIYFYSAADNSSQLFTGGNSVTGDQVIGQPLGPHQTITTSFPVTLDMAQANQFASFYADSNRMIIARVLLTISLITFLDSVLGHYQVSGQQDVPVLTT